MELLNEESDLEIYATKEVEKMNGYGIDGNMRKLIEILVNYWARKSKE